MSVAFYYAWGGWVNSDDLNNNPDGTESDIISNSGIETLSDRFAAKVIALSCENNCPEIMTDGELV